jgi:hypothetical protein
MNLHVIINIFKYINKLQRMAFLLLSVTSWSARFSVLIMWMSRVIIEKEIY